MALWKKIVLIVLAIPVLAVLAGLSFLFGARPRARALTDRTFEKTPARLERGKYLVTSVYGCAGCHGERDTSKPGWPEKEGKVAAGLVWSEEGMPWLTAPNLTPDKETGIGTWSDDALARAIREGIGHDGRALFAMMPYQQYRRIPDEDLASIIVYLRTLPAVRNPLPPSKLPFPLPLVMRTVPEPLDGPVAAPDLSTPVKRGEFLVRTIDCAGCHSARDDHGQPIPGLDLAGGNVFRIEGGQTVASTNLTPDPSGIPYYDEDVFVTALREGRIGARKLHPAMPYVFFGRMNDEDLKAMFAYLKTLPQARHQVSNTDPPTDCKRCGQKHGLGDNNAAVSGS